MVLDVTQGCFLRKTGLNTAGPWGIFMAKVKDATGLRGDQGLEKASAKVGDEDQVARTIALLPGADHLGNLFEP